MEKEEFMQIFIRVAFTYAINDQQYILLPKYLMCFVKPKGKKYFHSSCPDLQVSGGGCVVRTFHIGMYVMITCYFRARSAVRHDYATRGVGQPGRRR
jgi:hypothetical protein